MNPPVTVQLDPGVLDPILNIWREARDAAVLQRDVLNDQIAGYERNIAAIENASNQHLALSPSGRLRRGAAQGLIRDFLQGRNGTGATINAITQATGTTYATAHRVVKLLAEQDQVYQSDDTCWHWKGEASDQESLV